jgi:hypothetical protein
MARSDMGPELRAIIVGFLLAALAFAAIVALLVASWHVAIGASAKYYALNCRCRHLGTFLLFQFDKVAECAL